CTSGCEFVTTSQKLGASSSQRYSHQNSRSFFTMTDETKRIGDYQILDELGSGGMGRVWRVRNVITDRIEAMKVLLPDLAGRQELAARFLREIKPMPSVNHANIAALRTAFTADNKLYMVIEYYQGTSVADNRGR